jgi:hypothetical protein
MSRTIVSGLQLWRPPTAALTTSQCTPGACAVRRCASQPANESAVPYGTAAAGDSPDHEDAEGSRWLVDLEFPQWLLWLHDAELRVPRQPHDLRAIGAARRLEYRRFGVARRVRVAAGAGLDACSLTSRHWSSTSLRASRSRRRCDGGSNVTIIERRARLVNHEDPLPRGMVRRLRDGRAVAGARGDSRSRGGSQLTGDR